MSSSRVQQPRRDTTARRLAVLVPLLVAAVGALSCRAVGEVTAPPAIPAIPAGPPVALAMLTSDGQVVRSPVEFFVVLPQRWPARAVLVDSAGRAAGQPVAARWQSSDTTLVHIDSTVGVVTWLTGLKVGEGRVGASYVVGVDTLRLTNLWHIQR